MFAFLLGCLYLINALAVLWLVKNKFNLFGFIYNKKNKSFLLIYDLPFMGLSLFALLEKAHWILIILFLMHLLNSLGLIFRPTYFYQSLEEMKVIGESSLINYIIFMSTIAGLLSLYVSYL